MLIKKHIIIKHVNAMSHTRNSQIGTYFDLHLHCASSAYCVWMEAARVIGRREGCGVSASRCKRAVKPASPPARQPSGMWRAQGAKGSAAGALPASGRRCNKAKGWANTDA